MVSHSITAESISETHSNSVSIRDGSGYSLKKVKVPVQAHVWENEKKRNEMKTCNLAAAESSQFYGSSEDEHTKIIVIIKTLKSTKTAIHNSFWMDPFIH